jgi:NADH-quinone oxidoreductase subunit C
MGPEDLIDSLRARFGESLVDVADSFGDTVLVIRPRSVRTVLAALREPPFDCAVLLDLTCVDFAAQEGRYELVYHLYSLSRNVRLRLKASVPAEDPSVETLVGLWKNAEWLEREVFDMFGVRFEGHPLRRSYPWRLEQPRLPLKDDV